MPLASAQPPVSRRVRDGVRGYAPLASSRARASAASVASANTPSRCAACQYGDRALGGALRARHAAAQLGGVFAGCLEQRGRADEGLLRHESRLGLGEPLADRGFGERLDEEEDVGRPRAGDRRERVDLRLGHLDDAAHGLEQAPNEGDIRAVTP